MKKALFSVLLSVLALMVQAQIQEPVVFKSELKQVSGSEVEIVFTATIENGWHVYSTDLGEDGHTSATFNVDKLSGAKLSGKLKAVGNEISAFDNMFGMNVRYFENSGKFVQKLKLTGGDYEITGYLNYGACNDESCLPPSDVEFSYTGKGEAPAAPVEKEAKMMPLEKAKPVAEVKSGAEQAEPVVAGKVDEAVIGMPTVLPR